MRITCNDIGTMTIKLDAKEQRWLRSLVNKRLADSMVNLSEYFEKYKLTDEKDRIKKVASELEERYKMFLWLMHHASVYPNQTKELNLVVEEQRDGTKLPANLHY